MPTGKIFVVDDEEDILDLIRMNLEKEGYKVTCFENAENCIKGAINNPPRPYRSGSHASRDRRARCMQDTQR